MKKGDDMQIQPIKQNLYHIPHYPNKQEVEINRLLLEHRPKKWQKAPRVAAALSAAVILGLSGCGEDPDSYVPLWLGYPPSYKLMLTEDDAFMVLSSEFGDVGYKIEKNGGTIQDVQLPKELYGEEKGEKAPPQLDYTIKEENIKMEFISKEDMKTFFGHTGEANWLADEMKMALEKANPDSVYGTFYDPGTLLENNDKTEALENLRQQVKEFIKWLQAEEII